MFLLYDKRGMFLRSIKRADMRSILCELSEEGFTESDVARVLTIVDPGTARELRN